MALLTRKQIRKNLEAVSAELAELRTPKGIAAFLHSKENDEEFDNAVHEELEALRDAEVSDEPVSDEPAPATPDEAMFNAGAPKVSEDPAPATPDEAAAASQEPAPATPQVSG